MEKILGEPLPLRERSLGKQARELVAREVPLPDVEVVTYGFMPSEDLVTEARLRCWELVEDVPFEGAFKVSFDVDLVTGFDDTYTATVAFVGGPDMPLRCGLGSDPYSALARAVASRR